MGRKEDIIHPFDGFAPASKRAPMLSSLKKLETSIADFRLKTVMIAADL
jgi:hypothetical protein